MNNISPLSGPIRDHKKDFYIERDADRQTLLALQRGDIVTIIEPRQQGKTSLVYAIMRSPALAGIPVAYIDVSAVKKDSQANWYADFCSRVLGQLAILGESDRPALPADASEFRTFMQRVCQALVRLETCVIIVLDEVATVHFEGSTLFFAVLRDMYNSRESEKYFNQVTFLLSGAFSPQDLIQDPRVSPFNVAQRVVLHDFTEAQVRDLLLAYSWEESAAGSLSGAIQRWTGGQPYLCQALCEALSHAGLQAPDDPEGAVSAEVDRLFRSDDNHIRSLRGRLEDTLAAQPGLAVELRAILDGEAQAYWPAAIRWQEQLQLLGVIKENAGHDCQIRNPIYERLLQLGLAGSLPHTTPNGPSEISFVRQRLADLATRLGADQLLVDQCEHQLRTATEPRERTHLMEEIQTIRGTFPAYQQEYEILRKETQHDLDQTLHEVELRMSILNSHYDNLLKNNS